MILEKGTYWVTAKALSFEDVNVDFDTRQNFCETYFLSMTVSPTKSAVTPYFHSQQEEEYCESTVELPQKLLMNTLKRGEFVSDLSKLEMHVSYYDFTNEQTEGPYLLYFQLEYDFRQEGPVGVVLSVYDKEGLTWKETALYQLSDGESHIMKVVEKGIYGVSIQPIASDIKKFGNMGVSKSVLKREKFFASPCFHAKYTYLVTSLNYDD